MKIGFNFIEYGEVISTNDLAINRIADGQAREGDVICAQWQQHGRGHAGNVWESEPHLNLLCSYILQPHHLEPARQFLLTQVVSLAAMEVIQSYVPKTSCSVKWPNDLYVNNKKVGGILFQNTIRGNIIDFAVVGLGINVNQLVFSQDIPNPVSLRQLLKSEVSLEDFRLTVANSIKEYYQLTFSPSGIEILEKQYLSNLFRIGEKAIYHADDRLFEGVIQGVDEYGRLFVRMADGTTRLFQFKEIAYVI